MDCQNPVTVEVTQICGPNHFWILPHNVDVEKRIWLRRAMTNHFKRENRMEDFERLVYRKGDIVAVLWEEMWERGKVESISEQGFGEHQYADVFLIDKGIKVSVGDIPSNIRPILNTSLLRIEAQAKEFFLIGLTPVSKDFDYLESKMKNITALKWSELSQLLITDLLRLCEGIYIHVSHKEDNDNHMFKRLYGNMFLNMNIGQPSKITRLIEKYAAKKIYYKKFFVQNDPEMISVSQILIKGRFCIEHLNKNTKKSESDKENQIQEKRVQYVKKENALSSSDRLAYRPSEEVCEKKCTEKNKSMKSRPHIASVQRLLQWPLQEDIYEEQPIPPVIHSMHDDTNESSLFITAEGSSLKADDSIVVAGNQPNLGMYSNTKILLWSQITGPRTHINSYNLIPGLNY